VPTDPADRARFYDYSQISRIVSASDDPIDFEVAFYGTASLDDCDTAVNTADPSRVTNVRLFFPDLVGGLRTSSELDSSALDLPAALLSIEKTLVDRYSHPVLPIQQSIANQLPQALSRREYRIEALVITARPSSVLAMWKRMASSVRDIFPLSSPVPWPHESAEFFK